MPQIKPLRLSPTVSGYLFVIQNTLLAVSDPAVTNVVSKAIEKSEVTLNFTRLIIKW